MHNFRHLSIRLAGDDNDCEGMADVNGHEPRSVGTWTGSLAAFSLMTAHSQRTRANCGVGRGEVDG